MGWKNWPSWLNGGIILTLISTIYIIIIEIFGQSSHGGIMGPLVIIYIIPIFLIGAFIGWLYGKIKGGNNKI